MNAYSYMFAFTIMGFSVLGLSFLQFISHYLILPPGSGKVDDNEFKKLNEEETQEAKEL